MRLKEIYQSSRIQALAMQNMVPLDKISYISNNPPSTSRSGHDRFLRGRHHSLGDRLSPPGKEGEPPLVLLLDGSLGALPSLLAAPLLPLLDIPAAGAAAHEAELDEPSPDCRGAGGPHHGKHGYADVGADVDGGVAAEDVAHDDEENGGDDGGDCDAESSEESEDHDDDGPPAAVEGDKLERDHDEGKTAAGEEEAEHPVRDGSDETENVDEFSWERDCRRS